MEGQCESVWDGIVKRREGRRAWRCRGEEGKDQGNDEGKGYTPTGETQPTGQSSAARYSQLGVEGGVIRFRNHASVALHNQYVLTMPCAKPHRW